MLGGIKKRVKSFIKANLLNDSHPFFMRLYLKKQIRNLSSMVANEDSYLRVTYAEIEEEISRQFLQVFGRPINWDSPQTYNEKIQVSKVYMPDPIKTRLADKYLVREWIAEQIGNEYLIPLLGVYDSFDEIDFDALPDSFVIKCNHDSGSVTIVKDKRKIDRALLKQKYDLYMRRSYALGGWEMHYRDIPHKIVIEKYIDNAAVNDYRFYCFDGRPYYCAVDFYDASHNRSARNIYGMSWDIQPFIFQYPNYTKEAPCPDNFGELKDIAQKLAEGFPQVRVDLYSAGSKVFFGEMTFTHASGFQKLTPDEWDYKLGELWPFDNTVRAKVRAKYSRPADYHP